MTAVVRLAVLGWWLVSLAQAAPLPTVSAAYQQVASTEAAEAVLEAERMSTVSAQVAGRVLAIHFRPGDRVAQGQVILRLDPSVAEQEVRGAEARRRAAEVALAEAERQYRRMQELLAKHYVSQAQADQAAAAWQAAKAQLASVHASQGQAATTRGFATVVAPYSGVMSALHVEVGEMAVPGRPLATGFDPDALRATARVPQSRLEAVRAASAAWVELPGRADWLKATRVQLLPAADPRTHDTEVRVYLPAGLSGLMPGQFARVHFVTGSQRRLVVPAAAVVRRSELVAVYVLAADGRPQLRQVRLGEAVPGGLVEVRAGVKAGESVITTPLAATAAAH